ncbi:MAG: hypothetical protein QOH12_1569 [Solirubrobacteraceae bacterium]|jgi:DNA-binding FadR family transcriptional regulator|nr:hypothetical protein [Solirubrobacteraceae bacterium]
MGPRESGVELIAPEVLVSFERLDRGAGLADRVASAVADSIASGRLEPGDRLPSERDLGELFGVSRPVVREAVRSLKAKGLLADNPRRGHVVQALRRETVTESLTLYLRGRLDYGQLMEVRALVEVENAGLAAGRATSEQIDLIRAAAGRLRPGLAAEEVASADVGFHRTIATVSGNSFFEILIDSIREVLLTVQLSARFDEAILGDALRAHDEIVEQIAAGDAEGARAAMRAHLTTADRVVRALLRSAPGDTDVA